MIHTIKIRKSNVDELKKNIEKLNKKARKFGCEEMVLTFDNPSTISYDYHPVTNHHLLYPMVIEYVDATLEYEIPMIEGWELIAKLDIYPAENKDMVLVSAVPEKVVPAEYQNKAEIHCDHCGWNRNRHHSILIMNTESGEYKEVGSTCVKDFFGHDPRGFMFLAGIDFPEICRFKDEDSFNGWGRTIHSYELKDVLQVSSAVIKRFGWVSKGKAYDNELESTCSRVWDNLDPSPDFLKHRKHELVEVTDEDKETAELTIEHFKNVNSDGNDYLINLQKLIEMGYVPFKFMGFACSMVSSYNREMYKKEEHEKIESLPSDHVGEVGERLKGIQVKVLFTKMFESMYGTSELYIFQDASGNIMKTFYSGSKWSYDKDDMVLLTGTIKKHSEYNGKKETMLNRVVCNDAPDEAFTVDEFKIA